MMSMNDVLRNRETISALADGQLRGDEFARAVEVALADVDAQATWHAYHLVGDVLRSGERAACAADRGFVTRLQTRLRQEPGRSGPVLADPPVAIDLRADNVRSTGASASFDARAGAANESGFGWKLVAGFASLAAVAAIGWNALGGLTGATGQPVLALQAPAAAPAAQSAATLAGGELPVMIRDPRLDELLAAHKQFGGTSALQMPAGFLRNATFEGPAR